MSGKLPGDFKSLARNICGPAPDFSKFIAGLEEQLGDDPDDDLEPAAKTRKTSASEEAAVSSPRGTSTDDPMALVNGLISKSEESNSSIQALLDDCKLAPGSKTILKDVDSELAGMKLDTIGLDGLDLPKGGNDADLPPELIAAMKELEDKAASAAPKVVAPRQNTEKVVATTAKSAMPMPAPMSAAAQAIAQITTGSADKGTRDLAQAAAMASQPKAAPPPSTLPGQSLDIPQSAQSEPAAGGAVALIAQADAGDAAASSENDSKMAKWNEVLSMMAQLGLTGRAAEYLQALSKLQEASEEYLKRYTEIVVAMDQLLNTAYGEVVQAHLVSQIQAQKAAGAGDDPAAIAGGKGGFTERLPRRSGVPECKFYMTTGECHYGPSCKWDHPDRKQTPLNTRGFPLRPGESECAFYMRTSICKFGDKCRFNHPELSAKPVDRKSVV